MIFYWPIILDHGRRLERDNSLRLPERLQRGSTRNSSNQTEDQPERNKLPETRYRIQRAQAERIELWRHIAVTHVGRTFPLWVASRST